MSPSQQTVLVTGANGYIGSAVARALSNAGYRTYGLIRSAKHAANLESAEITPIIGSAADLSFLPDLFAKSRTFNIIVSTTEDLHDYVRHYNDTVALLRKLAEESGAKGVRPLVIFTSGCKDYGMTSFHGDPELQPHTELSPLNPPSILRPRAESAIKIFEHTDLFDAVVTRPTTLYGLSSSFYAVFFEAASKAAASVDGTLIFPADERSIMHGTHITDCAAAYIAIAQASRNTVTGQVYNISSHRYETVKEVGEALAKEYAGVKEVKYTSGAKFSDGEFLGDIMMVGSGFSQWVGSEKIRKYTGWTDVKPLFSEDVGVYRRAYEAVKHGHDGVSKILGYVNKAN